jgi:uncharacterized protein DUF4384
VFKLEPVGRDMTRLMKTLVRSACTSTIGLAALLLIGMASPVVAQSQNDNSRQIVLDSFTNARPPKAATATAGGSRTRPPAVRKRPTYRRVSGTPSLAGRPGANEQLGITVWRLRPSKQGDTGARVLVMENSQSSPWTPERIEADTPLAVGDRVRISVESPRAGYLYVVDREQYADGSFGDPYLIFPTSRTRGGDNRVRPGKLIDIPAQEDNPSYFTLLPGPGRSDTVAEVLSFMVTPAPLGNLPITDKPLKLSPTDVAKWEQTWSRAVERFEMNEGAGRPWTNEEKAAGAMAGSRLLTQEEPAPQTVYRIATKRKSTILVTVSLRYGK